MAERDCVNPRIPRMPFGHQLTLLPATAHLLQRRHLTGGQYQRRFFLELKGYVMNIDDMGDNTRLPDAKKPATTGRAAPAGQCQMLV